TRNVGMDGSRGVLSSGAARDRPGAHLILAHREEREQPQERIAVAEHALDGRLAEPEVGEEGHLLLARQLRDFGLDDGGDPADGRARTPGDFPESEALDEGLPAVDLFLREV